MKKTFLIFAICLLSSIFCFSQIRLPRLIRDSMILQRDVPVKIWGWSSKKEKIKMTAPVTQSKDSSGFLVQFTMPKPYTLDTLPIPNDSRVKLREMPAKRVAVFSYSGSWSESRYQEKLGEFKEALKTDSLHTVGEPTLARFNSPFQLWFLRRNEIWLETSKP